LTLLKIKKITSQIYIYIYIYIYLASWDTSYEEGVVVNAINSFFVVVVAADVAVLASSDF